MGTIGMIDTIEWTDEMDSPVSRSDSVRSFVESQGCMLIYSFNSVANIDTEPLTTHLEGPLPLIFDSTGGSFEGRSPDDRLIDEGGRGKFRNDPVGVVRPQPL